MSDLDLRHLEPPPPKRVKVGWRNLDVFVATLVIGGILGIVLTTYSWYFGPRLELLLHGNIVRISQPTNIKRWPRTALDQPAHICFTFALLKLREGGTPQEYDFHIKGLPLGTEVDDHGYVADQNYLPTNTYNLHHEVGERWYRYYCLNLDDIVPNHQQLAVTGESLFPGYHNWWYVPQPVPRFTVPALTVTVPPSPTTGHDPIPPPELFR